jgi:hypothetical protein
MSQDELRELPPRVRDTLTSRWVAIDPRGTEEGTRGITLRSGAVVVDHDRELAQLCRRLADAEKTSLTILYCA